MQQFQTRNVGWTRDNPRKKKKDEKSFSSSSSSASSSSREDPRKKKKDEKSSSGREDPKKKEGNKAVIGIVPNVQVRYDAVGRPQAVNPIVRKAQDRTQKGHWSISSKGRRDGDRWSDRGEYFEEQSDEGTLREEQPARGQPARRPPAPEPPTGEQPAGGPPAGEQPAGNHGGAGEQAASQGGGGHGNAGQFDAGYVAEEMADARQPAEGHVPPEEAEHEDLRNGHTSPTDMNLTTECEKKTETALDLDGQSQRDESSVSDPEREWPPSSPIGYEGFGAAAEYYEACRHDMHSTEPYFKCRNHVCLPSRAGPAEVVGGEEDDLRGDEGLGGDGSGMMMDGVRVEKMVEKMVERTLETMMETMMETMTERIVEKVVEMMVVE